MRDNDLPLNIETQLYTIRDYTFVPKTNEYRFCKSLFDAWRNIEFHSLPFPGVVIKQLYVPQKHSNAQHNTLAKAK